MPINSFLYPGAKVVTGYEVANSLRFDSGSSDYINRTVGTATNNKKITFSFWIKRSKLTSRQMFVRIIDPSSTASYSYIEFDGTSDTLTYDDFDGSSTRITRQTSQVFRDVSAWYHIVIATDTTQATGSDRSKVYINGSQVTSFASTSDASQNFVLTGQTSGKTFYIGAAGDVPSLYLSGYLAEFVVIDGQALDPTSFGEFDEDTGIWKPIDVSGLTFGTNGFYLDFEDSSALGNDVSGNDNDFTVNNLTSIDQSTDTCTNNFATMNVLDSQGTYSEGNLKVQTADSGRGSQVSTIGVSTGKWYAEFKLTATSSSNAYVGIDTTGSTQDANGYVGKKTYGYSYYSDGRKVNNESFTSYGNSYTTGDIIGVALNLDDNELVFYKNGTAQNSGTAISITAPSSTDTGFYFFAFSDNEETTGNVTFEANFGSPSFSISSGNSDGNGYGNFEYSVPSGYYALNTKNLSEYG